MKHVLCKDTDGRRFVRVRGFGKVYEDENPEEYARLRKETVEALRRAVEQYSSRKVGAAIRGAYDGEAVQSAYDDPKLGVRG
jgi:hypothetical protein